MSIIQNRATLVFRHSIVNNRIMAIAALLGIILACGGGFLIFLGIRKTNESNTLSRYVPADTVAGIPFGVPVVTNGTVAADQPLTSPVTQKPCVYFEYLLEREEETKDNNGNTNWQWRQVGSPERQSIPFYLQDQSGKILIKPDGCEVNGVYRTQQFLQPGTIQDTNSIGMKLFSSVIQMTNSLNHNRERVTESVIAIGANLNAFGIATMEGEQKFLQKTNDYPLVLSPLSKDQLVGSERKTSYIYFGLGAALVLVGLFLIAQK